jgi:hypothetical protein
MDYKCQIISMNKLTISSKGMAMPLCQSCSTIDCTNLIENKSVSISGEVKRIKLLTRGNDYGMVVMCEGYLPKKGTKV